MREPHDRIDASERNGARRAALITGAIALTGGAALGAGIAPIEFRFDGDAEGWTAIDVPGAQLCNAPGSGNPLAGVFLAEGGHTGGFYRYTEPGTTGIDPLFLSGTPLGSAVDALGGSLRYDRRISIGGFSRFDDVYLRGMIDGESVTLVADSVGRPIERWNASRVALVPTSWHVDTCDGPVATEAQLIAVLSNLIDMKLGAEYRSGPETNDIDNLMFLPAEAAPRSTFEADVDGWTISGDATISWENVAGPHPQCLLGTDQTAGVGYDFLAPAKFLGDQSAAAGRTLEFDLYASPSAAQTFPDGGATGFVRISGAGLTLRYDRHLGSGPTGVEQPITNAKWRHHAIPLRPCASWIRTSDDAPATQADFDTVLAAMDALRIRGEYRSGSEVERIDNVVLGACSPSVVVETSDAFETTACPGVAATFDALVAGAAPVTIDWQIESPPGSYDYVSLAGSTFVEPATGMIAGLSGVGSDTLVLTVDELGDHDGTIRVRAIAANDCGAYTSASARLLVPRPESDIDGDGVVGLSDLLRILIEWGPCPGCPEDLSGNDTVGFEDVLALLADWGETCE